MVGLAEYVCTHPILYLYKRRSRLCTWRRWVGVPSCTQPCLWIRVTRRRYRMAQDSDDSLFIINIVVWVWVVILAIVALLCPLPRRVVRRWTIWCNKCVISLLGLMFVSHLSLPLWGDASPTQRRLTSAQIAALQLSIWNQVIHMGWPTMRLRSSIVTKC